VKDYGYQYADHWNRTEKGESLEGMFGIEVKPYKKPEMGLPPLPRRPKGRPPEE